MHIREPLLLPATLSSFFFETQPPKPRPSENPDHLTVDPVSQGGRLTGVVLYFGIFILVDPILEIWTNLLLNLV